VSRATIYVTHSDCFNGHFPVNLWVLMGITAAGVYHYASVVAEGLFKFSENRDTDNLPIGSLQ